MVCILLLAWMGCDEHSGSHHGSHSAHGDHPDTSFSILLNATNEYVRSDIKTVQPVRMSLPMIMEVSGVLRYDTREVHTVSARTAARIERLYVTSRFQKVVKGQKLADLYSPDLVTEQENLIFLLDQEQENEGLIKASRNKLLLLGLSESQLEQVMKTRKSIPFITIYSPHTGHLHEADLADPNTMTNGMNTSTTTPGELSIKQGMYVSKGQVIFTVFDTKRVWAHLSAYPDQQKFLKTGMKVIIQVAEKNIEAKIDLIEPILQPNQTLLGLRSYIPNTNYELRPGSIIRARIYGDSLKGLFVPLTSVLSLGGRHLVFVREGTVFKATEIRVGTSSGDWISIVGGIDSTDSIAANGQLLIDSESFVRTKASK